MYMAQVRSNARTQPKPSDSHRGVNIAPISTPHGLTNVPLGTLLGFHFANQPQFLVTAPITSKNAHQRTRNHVPASVIDTNKKIQKNEGKTTRIQDQRKHVGVGCYSIHTIMAMKARYYYKKPNGGKVSISFFCPYRISVSFQNGGVPSNTSIFARYCCNITIYSQPDRKIMALMHKKQIK